MSPETRKARPTRPKPATRASIDWPDRRFVVYYRKTGLIPFLAV